MSGIDLVETLARRGIARPTIMISGRIDEAPRRGRRRFLVLEKPFDSDRQIDAIDRANGA